MKIEEFLKEVQNLPEEKKKKILWIIVISLACVMVFFWVRGLKKDLAKLSVEVKEEIPVADSQTIENISKNISLLKDLFKGKLLEDWRNFTSFSEVKEVLEKKGAKVSVILPETLPENCPSFGQSVLAYLSGVDGEGNYFVLLNVGGKKCEGSEDCYVATFSGIKGNLEISEMPQNYKEVKLAKGIKGYFYNSEKEFSVFKWDYKDFQYAVELNCFKNSFKEALDFINSAINSSLE